jgi:predicted ester cyclase
MGAAENLEIHTRWSEDNDRHDLSNYREYMHDDIEVFHLDGTTVKGLDAVAKNMADSIAAVPERRVIVEDRWATGDRVVCRWRVTGTPKGAHEGVSPTEIEGISVWEFQDGKAKRGWACSNAAFVMQKGGAGAADAYQPQGPMAGASDR